MPGSYREEEREKEVWLEENCHHSHVAEAFRRLMVRVWLREAKERMEK